MTRETQQKEIQINAKCSILGTRALYIETKEGRQCYKFRRITEEELLKIRKSGIPSFILKVGKRLYYTSVPKSFSINSNFTEIGRHMCAWCNRCRAIDESMGGCQKVSDCSIDVYQSEVGNLREAILMSKRIEKYDFVKYGFETFNVSVEVLAVIKCKNYMSYRYKAPMEIEKVRELQIAIEKYYYNEKL